MFIFQFRTVSAERNAGKPIQDTLESADAELLKDPKKVQETKDLTPAARRNYFMDKYREDYHKAFLKVGGTDAQWQTFVRQFEAQQRASQAQRQTTERLTKDNVLKSIPTKIASGQKYAQEATNEFLDQRPKTGTG